MRYLSIALIFWFSITTPVRVTGFMGWTLRAVVMAWGMWLTCKLLKPEEGRIKAGTHKKPKSESDF